jgi:hypothetical protein
MVSSQTSGKGGRSGQLRYELALLGKYRLLEANGFHVGLALEAVHGADSSKRDNSFYRAREFIERLLARKWALVDAHTCSRPSAAINASQRA